MTDLDVDRLIPVSEALDLLDSVPATPRTVEVDLHAAQGLVLAEDLRADRDYPPFDKSLMDGYAVRAADVPAPDTDLTVVGEIPAGAWPTRPLLAKQAFAIMTGAPLPPGADAVVPVEQTVRPSHDTVRILELPRPGRYIAPTGHDARAGAVVLHAGQRLEAPQLATAATVGAARVTVFARPRAAVLSTGDELVPYDHSPADGQIRNSNSLMLMSLLWTLGCDVTDAGHAPDDPQAIARAIQSALEDHDLLFISGGMSMGDHDYAPAILKQLGVQLLITKLRIKPGKPFVFGILAAPSAGGGTSVPSSPLPPPDPQAPIGNRQSAIGNPKYIFGLPGNPVSSFACTVRLASRLIARLRGLPPQDRWTTAQLATPLPANGPREFYQPGRRDAHTRLAHPLHWKGSADVFTLSQATGLLVRPENQPPLDTGASVTILEL
jgi:molybdopterin molybdotransferase